MDQVSTLVQNISWGAHGALSGIRSMIEKSVEPVTPVGGISRGRMSSAEEVYRNIMKVGRSDLVNYGMMAGTGVYAYSVGGMAALGSFAAAAGVGLAAGYGGVWLEQKLGIGKWIAERKGWSYVKTEGNTPVCKGDVLAHANKDLGLWGIIAGVAIGAFALMTFGSGLLVIAAAAAVGGLVASALNTMSQYGEVKGVIRDGSKNVTFENRQVARVGDPVSCKDHPGEPEPILAEGVRTVTVNGRLLVRVGHRSDCDGNVDGGCKTITASKQTHTVYQIRPSTSPILEGFATVLPLIPLPSRKKNGNPDLDLPPQDLDVPPPRDSDVPPPRDSDVLPPRDSDVPPPRDLDTSLESAPSKQTKVGKISPEEVNQRINLREKTLESLQEHISRVKSQELKSKIEKQMIGPAYAGVYDKTTGEYTFAANDPYGNIPAEIAPQLQPYFDSMTPEVIASYTRTRGAGSHAEVYAVNEALLKNPNARPEDLIVHVVRTGTDKTKPAGTMFPYCPHCGHILTDYHPISGVTKP